MSQHQPNGSETREALAKELHWKMEQLDPSEEADWEFMDEHRREFFRLCIDHIMRTIFNSPWPIQQAKLQAKGEEIERDVKRTDESINAGARRSKHRFRP